MLFQQFKRVFSRTLYKDQMILMGKMDFAKDFITDTRGDLYPVISASEDLCEEIREHSWRISAGETERMFCRFFPYITCEMTAEIAGDSAAGFVFHIREKEFRVSKTSTAIIFSAPGADDQTLPLPEGKTGQTWLVSCRFGALDIYLKDNGKAELAGTFRCSDWNDIRSYEVFSGSYVSVFGKNSVVIQHVSGGVDNGISTADIRPIRYEDGTPIMENGRIFFTVTIRVEEEGYQGIYSWVPGTADFVFTGALFYDTGDGMWGNDVAASILYHREEKKWLLWVCSFCHDHILGHSSFEGDPRYGVNVIDITLMKPMTSAVSTTDFAGKSGDEDPDFVYDPIRKKWLMAICRLAPETNEYCYYFYESESPFAGYRFLRRNADGAETGGSFVMINGERCFICGNSFTKRSDYRIYRESGMETPTFDFADGGFRGWGTLVPVKQGSRTRYYWVTFDRHNGSGYNWSYGNLYCFEADLA